MSTKMPSVFRYPIPGNHTAAGLIRLVSRKRLRYNESGGTAGVLFAIVDNPSHVSVYPIGGTVADWRKAGTASIWTQAFVGVSTKMK